MIGSKREVWAGTASHTKGGLQKSDLMKNKHGKIVSKRQHGAGQRAFRKNRLRPKTGKQLAMYR